MDGEIIDIRGHRAQYRCAFESFVQLYRRTFTDPTEAEDPAGWEERLDREFDPPEPTTHLLVAGRNLAGPDCQLWGGLVFEHYRLSGCGLMTYVAIDPKYRGRGLAKTLTRTAIQKLHEAAKTQGKILRMVFGEAEDPRKVDAQQSAIDPSMRLKVLAALGAKWVDIPYVQPKLLGGSGRCQSLLLLAFDWQGAPSLRADGAAVVDFLREFYQCLEMPRPDEDAEFAAMIRAVGSELVLKELPVERQVW